MYELCVVSNSVLAVYFVDIVLQKSSIVFIIPYKECLKRSKVLTFLLWGRSFKPRQGLVDFYMDTNFGIRYNLSLGSNLLPFVRYRRYRIVYGYLNPNSPLKYYLNAPQTSKIDFGVLKTKSKPNTRIYKLLCLLYFTSWRNWVRPIWVFTP